MSTQKNTAFNASHGDVSAATSKFLQELGEDGKRVVAQIKNDPAYLRRLANFAKGGGYAPTTSQERVQKIMGKHYIDPDAAMQHLGVQYTDQELAMLSVVPFSEAVLKECAKTHILIAGAPLSILEMQERAQPAKGKLFYSTTDPWYNTEKFVWDERVNVQWYLVREDAVVNSFRKDWDKQCTLLTQDECVPRACEVVYVTILTFLATGIRLFEKYSVRCSDFSSEGDRVCVGPFGADGLEVIRHWDENCNSLLGLASRRK